MVFVKVSDYRRYSVNIGTHILSVFILQPQLNRRIQDFPGGPVVKNPPAKAGDMGSIPGPGRLHMPRGN